MSTPPSLVVEVAGVLGCLEHVFQAEALLALVALGLVLAVVAVWALAVFRYSFAISYFEIERELIIRVALGL